MKKRNAKRMLCGALTAAMLAGVVWIPGAQAVEPVSRFQDVTGKDLTEAVERLCEAGIVNGTGNDTFHPERSLTRAEFVTMLGRAAKAQVDQSASSAFSDVQSDGWSTGYITWATENGLIEGDGAGNFHPYSYVTEEQVNQILDRYNEKFGTQVGNYPAPDGDATRANVAILLASGFTYEDTEPVTVTGGQISGYYTMDGQVEVYKGIPFAAPPVGELRWKAPQPVESWEGVQRCVNWSASAMQGAQMAVGPFTAEFIIEDTGYSEDCLYLNVWTKDDDVSDKPVIVYFHGGGLTSGGSSCEVYNGEAIARQDVVFVSIQYRVGVLGFLATSALSAESENGVSGNYGLLDQIAALEWVQDNIAQFGGDPDNVTIMGQSAGGRSVNALTQSPLAEGLFDKMVSMSGYQHLAGREMPTLDELEAKYDPLFSQYTLEELRAMPADELQAIDNSAAFCLDGWVFTEQYMDALRDGTAAKVDVMLGHVTGDAGNYGAVQGAGNTVETYEKAVRDTYGEYADRILELYPATSDEEVADVLNTLNLDTLVAQAEALAQARAKNGLGNTYLYLFSHALPSVDGANFGAFHSYDIPYFMNNFTNGRAGAWTEEDYALGNTINGYLINFARTGNPNGEGLPQWDASQGTGYLQMDLTCTQQRLSPEKEALFAEIYGG